MIANSNKKIIESSRWKSYYLKTFVGKTNKQKEIHAFGKRK